MEFVCNAEGNLILINSHSYPENLKIWTVSIFTNTIPTPTTVTEIATTETEATTTGTTTVTEPEEEASS